MNQQLDFKGEREVTAGPSQRLGGLVFKGVDWFVWEGCVRVLCAGFERAN